MLSDGVVHLPPVFGNHPRFPYGIKELAGQKLIPKVAIEAFVEAVLPGAPRLDDKCPHPTCAAILSPGQL